LLRSALNPQDLTQAMAISNLKKQNKHKKEVLALYYNFVKNQT
jgi:hypothetical protein